MRVRQARDTMLMILKWSGVEFNLSWKTMRSLPPLQIMEIVAEVIERLETKFGLLLGVFYKALYRACIPK